MFIAALFIMTRKQEKKTLSFYMMNDQRNYSTMYLTYHVLQIPYKTTQQEKGKTIKVDNDLNESSEFMLNEKNISP